MTTQPRGAADLKGRRSALTDVLNEAWNEGGFGSRTEAEAAWIIERLQERGYALAATKPTDTLLEQNRRLREALKVAVIAHHYDNKHQSVKLGRHLMNCTEGHCVEWWAALAELDTEGESDE